jgi:hypothetical protein
MGCGRKSLPGLLLLGSLERFSFGGLGLQFYFSFQTPIRASEFFPMDVESDLEHRAALAYLRFSRRGRGGHTAKNGVLFHRAGESTKDSPASLTCHLGLAPQNPIF